MADAQQPVSDSIGGVESKLERRNSLEKHLQTRPEEKDLKDRHILLDTTAAPALQARQAELERQRITDNLKKVSTASSGSFLYTMHLVVGDVEANVVVSLGSCEEAREGRAG